MGEDWSLCLWLVCVHVGQVHTGLEGAPRDLSPDAVL